MLTRTVRGLARLYPADVEASDDLARALSFLEAGVTPANVVRAGYGAGAVVACCVLPFAFLPPTAYRPIALVLGTGLALGVVHAVHRGPIALAALGRSRALGAAPDLIGRAILRMRVDPATESAVAFAADSGDGPLAASLRRHVRATAGAAGSGLDGFAAEWREWFPALARACHLLAAAGSAGAARRERALERSLEAVLEGTHERLQSFVTSMGGPITALYAFGVLLPLALVAVVPGARAAGLPVTLPVVVVIYDLVLPAILVGAAGWLLVRRPVAFPAPPIDRSHPDVPDRPWAGPLAGVAVGGIGAVLATILIGQWAGAIALCGIGGGVALVVYARPIVAVREEIRAIENGLPDALYLIGRRVDDGYSVERALELAAEQLPDATGDLLADAARRCRVLGVGPDVALRGEHGALATVPSRRVHSTAQLLTLATQEGTPAGQAIIAMAGHLEDLQSVEREARHSLARLTGTLRNTAAIFGPLVAGATVALADGMGAFGADTEAVGTMPTAGLGIAVGAYVLLLAVVLTTLATGIEHGLDRPLASYRVGLATTSATVVFLVGFLGAGLLF
ncbi:hypothetical protein L593_10450 [Salinarchaeum sp. Harcht-Bsk1]|uniref:type II secretion system F family protein n=1 Tax=Salinarchaeum sp. Harcht-Bsk1 TaxID=1333523 RepID=UPI0003422C6D|nr:hypothetical protein [Salinarchaeum sp. Harcht-Bsk1]AGN02035.1 hypothetical protein L593_10450 [Salinarchaeum sp. Harcht-Bsk1]